MTDDILEDGFHLCALRAYLEVYSQTGQFPPDSEATRRRAYQLYEEALAEKNNRQPICMEAIMSHFTEQEGAILHALLEGNREVCAEIGDGEGIARAERLFQETLAAAPRLTPADAEFLIEAIEVGDVADDVTVRTTLIGRIKALVRS